MHKKPLKEIPRYKDVWKVGYPIILSLIAQNVVNVTDTAFLGRLGEVALGAAAIGGLLYISIYMLGYGFSTGAQILIARRNGEKKFNQTGEITDQALYASLILGVFITVLLFFFTPTIIRASIQSKDIADASITFLEYRIWGLSFVYLNAVFRAFYVGITNTRILSISAAIMAGTNIFLDYTMIFGHFGFPAMGIAGAAIASVISEMLATLYFVVKTTTFQSRKLYAVFGFSKPNFRVLKQILDLSIWMMLQNFLSLASWLGFFMIVEKTGEHNLAISNIIRSIYLVLIIPIMSLGTVVNTMVSNSIGSYGPKHVFSVIKVVMIFSTWLLIIPSAFTLLFPELLIRIYTSDLQLIADSVSTLRLIGGLLFLFNISYLLFQAVSATGNTRTSLAIEAFTIAVYLGFSYLFAIPFKLEVFYIWSSEYIYFSIMLILSMGYMLKGDWRSRKI